MLQAAWLLVFSSFYFLPDLCGILCRSFVRVDCVLYVSHTRSNGGSVNIPKPRHMGFAVPQDHNKRPPAQMPRPDIIADSCPPEHLRAVNPHRRDDPLNFLVGVGAHLKRLVVEPVFRMALVAIA
jgi:hypothetical protein